MSDDNDKEEDEDVTQRLLQMSLESVLDGMSEEHLKELKNRVSKLVAEDPQINMACAVLVNSRRLYSMAREALTRDMDKLGYKWEDGSEELVIVSMGEMASADFLAEEVLPVVKTHIPLFVETEIALYTESPEESEETTETGDEDDAK